MDNPRVVFLRGEKTILRPYDPATDLELFTGWMNDPDMRDYGFPVFPLTQAGEEEKMRTMTKPEDLPKGVFLVVERCDEPGPIGTVGLHRINWINRTAVTGSLIGVPELRSNGFGTDAKVALLRYAFNTLGLRLIESRVLGNNGRSTKALNKQGYVEVGRLPQWQFRDGTFVDEIIFVLTREAFEAKHPKK